MIGNDFLLASEANIDYNNLKLVVKSVSDGISIFRNVPNNTKNQNQNNKTILEPRSETFIKINILNQNITKGLTPDLKIYPGVFLAKAILKVDNKNQALTSILNTTDKKLKIDYINLMLDEIPECENIFNLANNSNSTSSSDRTKLLHEYLKLDHLSEKEKQSVETLCKEFKDIFYLPGEKLTSTDSLKHEIITNNSKPITSKIYRFPKVHEAEVNKQIKKMLQENIIKPSNSPYNAPLWVVTKKLSSFGEQKWRVVVDYQNLNQVTEGMSFPLPKIDKILDQLGHSC